MAHLLLDTHVLIWWLSAPNRLGLQARTMISERSNTIWVSAVSIWEIAIKTSIGRVRLEGMEAEEVVRHIETDGFQPMPVTFRHALGVAGLPVLHRDPFDRLLISQSVAEGCPIMTADNAIKIYDLLIVDADK